MAIPPPPRPPRRAPDAPRVAIADTPAPATPPAELDEATRVLLTDAIARAVAAELGRVRISSIPPASEPASDSAPRSSIRVAAKVGGKVGKWGVLTSGALALVGQVIVWTMRPEYATPLAQALKLIGGVISSLAGGAPDVAP